MKVLAVDTSSLVAAVAVMEDDRLLGEYLLNHKKTHSQKLMPMVVDLLGSLELKPGDIDVYAASSGPGSFTGLRIGITTVKAMAYAVRKPVISVPTLDALAYNIPMTESLVCPIMDARNMQVYTALYKWDGNMQKRLTDYMGIHVSELVREISGRNSEVVFVGDAAALHKDFLTGCTKISCKFAPPHLQLQRASSVARLAVEAAARGELENCYDMVPFYLRKSQAERELEKR